MRIWRSFVYVCVLMLVAGCSEERGGVPSAPTGETDSVWDAEAAGIAWGIVDEAGWPAEAESQTGVPQCHGGHAPLLHFERTPIAGDVVHYSIQLRVGPGQYDVIGLHRVVRESRPHRPIRTAKSVFMQHGSSKTFVGMWLPGLTSETTPDDFGMGYYLAANDIDVWGIDQSWTLVPGSETNTDFMADWGLERQMGDLRTAVSVARLVRLITGCGRNKMILAGYSNGIPTTISLVNEETQLPPVRRNVGGYIPIDCPIRVEPGLLQETLAFYSEYYQSLHDGGLYGEEVLFAPMAELVRCCPEEPSPFDPTLTNLEFALLMSAGPVLFPGHPFHYWAGVLEEGMPVELRFVDWELWLDFLASGTAYEPIIWTVDWCGYVAGILDTPYDDHFAEIEIPILNITPAGGFAEATYHGLSLLGSTDVETLMPAMGLPVEEEYAHIDIFTYPGSEQLVWQPILEWIVEHSD